MGLSARNPLQVDGEFGFGKKRSEATMGVHYRVHKNVQKKSPMKQTTFTELRSHAKAYFDLVESGESVRVLRNGKPIADIVPIAPDVPSWKRRKAQPLVIKGVSLSRLLREERDAGR